MGVGVGVRVRFGVEGVEVGMANAELSHFRRLSMDHVGEGGGGGSEGGGGGVGGVGGGSGGGSGHVSDGEGGGEGCCFNQPKTSINSDGIYHRRRKKRRLEDKTITPSEEKKVL